jgi:hypothetical protein
MLSLADATRDTRLIAKFGAIIGGVLIFLFLSFRIAVFIYGIINPPTIEPPEMRYGKLTSNFPPQISKPTYTYQIGTITGNLPRVPDRIRVYKIFKPEPDLLALQKARESLRLKGYFMVEKMITTNEYSWNNTTGGSITYNVLTRNFSFESGIGLERQEFILPAEKEISGDVLEYITSINGSLVGIDQENIKIKYLQSDGNELTPEEDTGNAYMAQVDLTQIPIKVDPFTFVTDTSIMVEALPVYYESNDHTNQTFIVKAGIKDLQFVSGMFKNYQVDLTEHSTYPLKTPEIAFEDLKNGNAYILSTNTDTTVNIAEMKLGYFIPESTPEYILPIFVFTGKDFVAYVHAIATATPPDQNVSN